MKTSRALAVISASAALLLCAACHKGADSAAPGRIRIGVIPKATTHAYWKGAEAGARRAAAELGVELEWQGPLDDSKVADQIGIFNNLAASGVRGILLSPCDDKALAPHVRTASRRGAPVVIFDSPLDAKLGTDYLAFIGTNNDAAGALAADTLTRLVGDAPTYGGKTVVIQFREGSASTRVREAGFFRRLQGGKLNVVAAQHTDGSLAGAQRVAEVLLNGYVKDNKLELDAIFASNEPTGEGTYNAVKALRDKGVGISAKFVGFDDSDLLLQGLSTGVVSALIVQDPDKMAYLGVTTLVASIRRQPFERNVNTGVTVKTKADLK